MIYLITQTLNGLFSAALLFLIAGGLTLVFGVMRIVNIAHGSFYMLGVYVAYTVMSRTHSLLLATIGAVLVVASIGFGVERLFLRRFASRPLPQMMMTMGFALVFRDAIRSRCRTPRCWPVRWRPTTSCFPGIVCSSCSWPRWWACCCGR